MDTNTNPPKELNISSETSRFEEHLNLAMNDKIIFSGIFGIGKTYFLKKFFANHPQYESFYLTPVNYSIAQTDDILEYIKYDILYDALGKDEINFQYESLPKTLTAQFYLKENLVDTGALLLEGLGSIGKSASILIKNIKKISEKITEHHTENQINELDEISTFFKTVEQRSGSIHERGRVIELISSCVNQVYESGKEPVLVIDDLDRLDPEHIFRVLNVFACHMDSAENDQNKFGFAKVIVVCDIENVRNIFSARYGSGTDFSGYIDKFYSHEVFHLNNRAMILSALDDILIETQVIYHRRLNKLTRVIGGSDYTLLKNLLAEFISINKLNLRSLLRLPKNDIPLPEYRIKTGRQFDESTNYEVTEFLLFDFLAHVFRGETYLSEAIESLYLQSGNRVAVSHELDAYSRLLALAEFSKHRMIKGQYKYRTTEGNEFEYFIKTTGPMDNNYFSVLNSAVSVFPLGEVLHRAFKEYQGIRIALRNNQH